MKRVLLIFGCLLLPLFYLYLSINQTVRAVELMPPLRANDCPGCGPTLHFGEEQTAVPAAVGPNIYLTTTVDTNPNTCASSQEFTLPPGGGRVYYCYFVGNSGDVILNLHTVVDDQYGTLLGPSFPLGLIPGATAWFTVSVDITQTIYNSATWSAFNPGPTDLVTATDSALVIVEGPITALTATNNGPTPLGRETKLGTMIVGGGNESYLWDFGDGTTGTGAVASHIYPALGVYTAVVTATNSFNSLTATTVITINHANYLPAVRRN